MNFFLLSAALSPRSLEENRYKVKYHFIRDKISEGIVEVEKISTDDNPADMGTKIVSYSKFKHCLNLLKIGDYG